MITLVFCIMFLGLGIRFAGRSMRAAAHVKYSDNRNEMSRKIRQGTYLSWCGIAVFMTGALSMAVLCS